ncbi:MAG: response regulator [Chloroflexota bacterium]|nr:response regulator [Chloroflexota bacterium]
MTKILVVEDNEMNRNLLKRRLVLRGYEVVEAQDGAVGVALALAEHPDVILMDINMPVLDGWSAIRQIRAAPITHAIPVIAVTATTPDEARRNCVATGCNGYVGKPIDFYDLLAQIQGLLAS